MRLLKQSTSVDVPIGPFLDETTGKDAETALTITQPDIRLKKNGGAWAQKAAAQTLTHEENGNYEVTLDATDTDTLGLLRLHVHEAGALPVWDDFMVMPANVWDSLFGADKLQVDLAEWLGTAPLALVSQRVDASVGAMAAGVLTAAAIAASAITGAKLDPDVTAKLFSTTALTEAYPADGAAATPTQLLYLILAVLAEFAISGTTLTAKKLDGVTTAATYTLDDASNPSSRTRAT